MAASIANPDASYNACGSNMEAYMCTAAAGEAVAAEEKAKGGTEAEVGKSGTDKNN